MTERSGTYRSSKRREKTYVRDSAFQSKKLKMRKGFLFFESDDDSQDYEAGFRRATFLKYKKITRLCIIGLICLCLALIVCDPIYLNYGWNTKRYLYRSIARFGAQVPVCLIWYAATQQSQDKSNQYWISHRAAVPQRDRKWFSHIPLDKVATISAFVVGLSILAQTIISREPDHGIYMLYFFMVYLFMGIPFFYALIVTWTLAVLFIVTMWAIVADQTAIGHFQSQSFELSVVYLAMSNLLLTIAAHAVEKNDRTEFMHGLDLDHQESIVKALLDNLLPEHVTEQLRENRTVIAEKKNQCSILFSDLVSFTKWASQLRADMLIHRLHDLYTRFDKLCDDHGVYKVETIGDAYFVSSNCPIDAADHADRLMILGKCMMFDCLALDWDGYTPRMRIGIHTGEVMAGVVGTQMPRYHLFGDTVMIAEALESSGEPEHLHVSEMTRMSLQSPNVWGLVKRPEKVEVMTGRTIQTYLVRCQNTYAHVVEEKKTSEDVIIARSPRSAAQLKHQNSGGKSAFEDLANKLSPRRLPQSFQNMMKGNRGKNTRPGRAKTTGNVFKSTTGRYRPPPVVPHITVVGRRPAHTPSKDNTADNATIPDTAPHQAPMHQQPQQQQQEEDNSQFQFRPPPPVPPDIMRAAVAAGASGGQEDTVGPLRVPPPRPGSTSPHSRARSVM